MLEGVMLIMVVHRLNFEFVFARCRETIFYSSYLLHGHWQVERLLICFWEEPNVKLIVNAIARVINLESKFKLLNPSCFFI